VQVISKTQHHALAFIDACGRSGYKPTSSEVELWLDEPEPSDGLTGAFQRAMLARFMSGAFGTSMSNHLKHLVSLGWIENNQDRLSLTTLGRALLLSADRSESVDSDASVIILDSEDQFAYAKLIGYLNQAGEGLLLDPYFRIDQLMTILNGTSLTRVLISKQHKNSKADRAALAVALQSPALPRNIEIRASSDAAVHE